MKLYESLVLLLGFLTQVLGTRIVLDEKAMALCKKFKTMCKEGKICAAQHFDGPNNMSMPVCIPLNFVPAEYKHHVRNLICQLPPEQGTCDARYIRWYYNVHRQECTHFRYGGCKGNQNNFMTKKECEDSCLQSTSINLYNSPPMVPVKPSVMQPPVYEPPSLGKYEALNSILITDDGKPYEMYPNVRYPNMRPSRSRTNESNRRRNRRRLEKERDKERRRREKKKEKRRQRRLRQKNKKRKEKKYKKDKSKKKKIEEEIKTGNDTMELEGTLGDQAAVVDEVQKIITNEIVENEEDGMTEREKRKERKRKKRRQRKKRRLGKDKKKRKRSYNRYSELRGRPNAYSYKMFSILDRGRDFSDQKNSAFHRQS